MRCFICGIKLGNMQVHPEEECERQQKTNESNLVKNGVISSFCCWCGGRKTNHEQSCPNR